MLQAYTVLNGSNNYTDPIINSVIFAEPENNMPIISCGFFNREITQYNTIFIPIVIYSADNTASNATVILREEGIIVDTWENVSNSVIYTWNYTPTLHGTRLLTI
jgi:hypothetical protein